MPSSPENAPVADRRRRLAAPAAAIVAASAFALYYFTLLPGLDFGDTASFQTMVGAPIRTPRDGYPLYFAIGDALLRVIPGEPARVLNMASAIEGAAAAGLMVFVGAELSGSILAAAGGALLFAASYTFWSQAIIAEVYALHALFVCASLLALLRWERQPTTGRLALFFGIYALGFGNHLSMVLLLPGFTVFVLAAAPGGWRSMLRPSVVTLAAVIACAGAAQYLGELRALWLMPQPPATVAEGLRHFWFDVTKSDWRDTMVMNVPRVMLGDHAAMYWFDLRQQFGWVIPLIAAIGCVFLTMTNAKRAALIATLYIVNALFAFGYNVGDTHVFYLPSHLCVALLAGCGVVFIVRKSRMSMAAAALLIAYASAVAYDNYPAMDRSNDRRPSAVLTALTTGVDDLNNVLLADLNWQVQNGLGYFARTTHPEIAYATTADVLLYAPQLIADNAAIGRAVLVTPRAREALRNAYGPLLDLAEDARVPMRSIADTVRDLPAGTRYVLTLLRPSRDLVVDRADVLSALRSLTGGRLASLPPDGEYAAVAGFTGDAPSYLAASTRPFRRTLDLAGTATEIRMESWLASDTIRRMGFGQVIAGRHHTLIVERGVSFVAFDERGVPVRTAYAANIFAPQARYIVRPRPGTLEAPQAP